MNEQAPNRELTRVALLILSCGILVTVMNSSISSIVLPEMGKEFEIGPDALSWVVTAYLIPFATFTVLFGRLADMAGSRRIFLLGLAIFGAAALGVAASPSFAMVIAMRVAQGIGGAAVPSLAMATIRRLSPPERLAAALGVTVIPVGLGFGFGPIVGGALTEWFGWQGPFLFSAATAFLLLPFAIRWVPGFAGERGQRFDPVGAAILLATVTGLVVALNRQPRSPGDAVGLGSLAVAFVALVGLVFWLRRAAEPFVAPAVFRNARFIRMAVVGFTAQGAHFAVIVIIPLLLTQYHEMEPIEIGLYLLPGAIALGASGVIGGLLMHRVGARILVITGTWLLLAGIVTFHLAGVDYSPLRVSALYLLIATGYGVLNSAIMPVATGELDDRLAGVGTGVFNLCFFIGGAIAVAVAGGLLEGRADATEAWNPLFKGTAIAYSDALIVVVLFAAVGFILAALQPPAPAKPSIATEEPVFERFAPAGPRAWALKPRSKPNMARERRQRR